jgi:spermidine synthase
MNKKIAITLFTLSVLFTGASGLVNEYILSTVTTYILGNSIEQFSLTIALMLGFMGVGGFVQKFVSNNNLILKFSFLEISLSILGGLTPILIYATYTFIPNHFNLIQYFLITSIGFLIGFEIPFIIRINETYTKSLKDNLSFILSADYIGSLIGTLIWLYVLIPLFPIYKISFIVSASNLFIAFITFIFISKIVSNKIKIIGYLSFLISFLILFLGYINSEKINIYLEQRLYNDPIKETKTTKYQHLVITHNNVLNDYRLYINGNTQFSSLDEVRYHELLVHPIMALSDMQNKDILIIGGGDGLALRELKKYKNINSITLIDLDPGMIDFAKNSKILRMLNKNAFKNVKIINPKFIKKGSLTNTKDNKRINLINIDADKMLWSLEHNLFDIVIVDLPDPSSIELNKLYSKEFFLKLNKVMKPNAIGIIQSTSPFHAKNSFLIIGNTVKTVFNNTLPIHYNIPSFGEWGWWIFSENTNLNKDINIINNTSFLTNDIFKASKIFGKNDLNGSKEINSLMNPILFYNYINSSWKSY